jgi:hypothetical protein
MLLSPSLVIHHCSPNPSLCLLVVGGKERKRHMHAIGQILEKTLFLADPLPPSCTQVCCTTLLTPGNLKVGTTPSPSSPSSLSLTMDTDGMPISWSSVSDRTIAPLASPLFPNTCTNDPGLCLVPPGLNRARSIGRRGVEHLAGTGLANPLRVGHASLDLTRHLWPRPALMHPWNGPIPSPCPLLPVSTCRPCPPVRERHGRQSTPSSPS